MGVGAGAGLVREDAGMNSGPMTSLEKVSAEMRHLKMAQ